MNNRGTGWQGREDALLAGISWAQTCKPYLHEQPGEQTELRDEDPEAASLGVTMQRL